MRISPAMLLFALFDSGVAFFLVYYMVKAKFGGDGKSIARTLAAVFATITFIVYFAVIVWFNTYPEVAGQEVKMLIYLAPIVLTILMLVLVQLSKPYKIELPEDETQNEDADGEESDESDTEETEAQ